MTPFQTWKANKGRLDLRQYTREFQKRFSKKTVKISEVCNVYVMTYRTNNESVTDKHHAAPVIMSFGRFRNYNDITCVRGLNLLFLSTNEMIDLMEKVYTFMKFKPDDRVAGMIKLHEHCIKKFPHAFKNFEEPKMLVLNEVDKEDWGMIPLLHKHLLGTFNNTALKTDYITENAKPILKPKAKKEKKPKEKPEVETVSVEWTEGDTGINFDDDI